jgi:hypothetical protein
MLSLCFEYLSSRISSQGKNQIDKVFRLISARGISFSTGKVNRILELIEIDIEMFQINHVSPWLVCYPYLISIWIAQQV